MANSVLGLWVWSEHVAPREAGGGRTAIRVVPAALAALADGVSADAAAQIAMGRLGERDLAAGLLAERIRAADAFAATYGVPWWPAYVAIDRAISDDGDPDGGQPSPRSVRWAATGSFVALALRLGYVDGVRGLTRARGATDDQGAAFIDAAMRCRRAMRAYRSGRAYGSAERILMAYVPAMVALIDARATTLRAWVDRWRWAVRWALRGDVRGRLLAGRRIRDALAALRGDAGLARHEYELVQRAVWVYAGGWARAIRQRAARRAADLRVTRASSDPVEGAMLACAAPARARTNTRGRVLVRGELALDLSAAGVSPADIAELAEWTDREPPVVERRPDLFGPRDADGSLWASNGVTLGTLMNALTGRPPVGRAWGRAGAVSQRAPRLDEAMDRWVSAPTDRAMARIVLAECELVTTCARTVVAGAEGWVRAYRTEADALPVESAERAALLARAAAVDAALEARADREGRARFAECLQSDDDEDGRFADRCLCARHDAHDVIGVLLSLQEIGVGGGPDADAWAARVDAAIDREAERWLVWARGRAARRSARGRVVAIIRKGVDVARRGWRWVTAPTGLVVGSPERVTSRRLVQGRPVMVITGLTVVAFVLLDAARTPAAIAAAHGLVAGCFVVGAWMVASRPDVYWWRSGTTSLVLAAILAAIIAEPPGSSVGGADRLSVPVALWGVAAPLAVFVARRLGRRRTAATRAWSTAAREHDAHIASDIPHVAGRVGLDTTR